ncbi:ABC-F family ATP-binding cassette domain-containing protein [Terrabacter sp. GCM10028922]|uniref:ABC-F family ATP-binding cassette domain-containing protein n=1 Tax=Terrabacter sp. GCM10028922 TaxID=3273428 RepID=UPI003610D195
MPSTLTITDLAVAFGARTLFTGLDLTLSDGDVTAVVGPNGSGKSTLMRTIVGELPVDAGSVRLTPRDATVAWLPQLLPDPEETLLAYARRRTGVTSADTELECASAAIASGMPESEERYATALERWLALGAADLDERLPEVAARVGLDVDGTRPLGTLSGGQAARACLVAVLLSQYDVLLLDEPTNNLDSRGLDLMADFVRGHDGPVLIASHDRTFLDAVTTSVVELDVRQQRIAHYTGGWSDYVVQRELARTHAWEAYEGYAAERDSLLAQARQRHDWADKGRRNIALGGEPDKHIREKHRARADRQAAKGARLARAAGRLDAVDQPRKEWQLRYTITEGPPSADVVATLADAVVERHGFRLGPVGLVVGRGDRVAIVGDNGSGKTTLLAALLGDLPLTSGRQSLGTRVSVGVIDQRRQLLEEDVRVLDVVRRELGHDPKTGQQWPIAAVRTLLAKFGLGAEHVSRPARSLSMGERTRALMALFQGREVNVLVLDEPTNHLDVDAIEQLEAAVAAFGGTVLVVSHDEHLLDGIRLTHRWHVVDGRVEVAVL